MSRGVRDDIETLRAREKGAEIVHVKTCEMSGGNCKYEDCPLAMCGECGESWPCAVIAGKP